MKFTQNEIKDLIISTFVLGLAFSRFDLELLPLTLFLVAVTFLPHELLGHKYFAQRYGADAEYKSWSIGLFIGVISGLLGGIVFAAPGAVHVSPFSRGKFAFRTTILGRREFGIISLAGPVLNIIIGFICLGLIFFVTPHYALYLAARISFFLALFNLMPFPPLDGMKVIAWKPKYWVVTLAVCLLGYFAIA